MDANKTKNNKLLQQLQKDLPVNWVVQFSEKYQNRVYYFNTVTRKSTWTHPNEKGIAKVAGPVVEKSAVQYIKIKSEAPAHQHGGLIYEETCSNQSKNKLISRPTKSVSSTKSKTAHQQRSETTRPAAKKQKKVKSAKKKSVSFDEVRARRDVLQQAIKQRVDRFIPTGKTADVPKLHPPSAIKRRSKTLLASWKTAKAGGKRNDISPESLKRKRKLKKTEEIRETVFDSDFSLSKPDEGDFDLMNSGLSIHEHSDNRTSNKAGWQNTFLPASSSQAGTSNECSVDTSRTDVEMQDVSSTCEPPSSPYRAALVFAVVDTNILLMDLHIVSAIVNWGSLSDGHFRRVIVVVPWIVFQELDGLKSKKEVMSSARNAVAFLNRHLSDGKPGLRGQTIMEAATFLGGMKPEMNDDRVLQCCFFFRGLPGRHKTFLLTRDTNLQNKALINHFRTFSSAESLMEAVRVMNKAPNPELDDPNATFSSKNPQKQDCNSATKCDPAVDENESSCGCFTFLEPAVTTALSLILEKEMKEAYGDQLWTEIVYIKPPWTLTDVLACVKKHWIAVFGMINTDRIASHLVDELSIATKRILASRSGRLRRETTAPNRNAEKEWLSMSTQLLKLLNRPGRYAPEVSKSLERLENASKPSTHRNEPEPAYSQTSSASCNKDTGVVGPRACAYEAGSVSVHSDIAFDEVSDDHQSGILFWQALDEVWHSVVTHCVAIFKSLSFVTSSSFTQSPMELQQELSKSSTDLPSPEMSFHVLPLLMQLVTSLINSIERISCHFQTASPLPSSDCVDLLQTIWTTTQAFTLHCNVERLRPSVVQQCLDNDSGRTNLSVGCIKLRSVLALLNECYEFATTGVLQFEPLGSQAKYFLDEIAV